MTDLEQELVAELESYKTENIRLLEEQDEWPTFLEVAEMGDRLSPLADYLDALGFDNDAAIIRMIIEPPSKIRDLKNQLQKAQEELEWEREAHKATALQLVRVQLGYAGGD